jgi:DNA repair photolyase
VTDVSYREVEVKGALNEVRGMPFEWSLNPFLGCAHACFYCFSRAYHARYREKNVGSDFDSNVEVRVNIADVLRKELHRHREGSLAIGTATDPYQPIEGKYRLTRRCLEALVDHPMPTSIVTKGPLVVRDIDVLKKLDEKTDLTVYFSVPCVDEDIVRKTDPGTAPPRQRLRALRMLREAGIDAAVLCMPVLPGISDTEESLDAAARAASEAGATTDRHRPLKIEVEIQQYY